MAGTARSHARIRSHGGADWLGARGRTRDERRSLDTLERWDRRAERLLDDEERQRALVELLHLTVSRSLDRVLPLRPTRPPPPPVCRAPPAWKVQAVRVGDCAHTLSAPPGAGRVRDVTQECFGCGDVTLIAGHGVCYSCRTERHVAYEVVS